MGVGLFWRRMPWGQPLRMAMAIAATECSVMHIEKSPMVAMLHE